MDDTISRAAALDALGERPVVWSDNDDYTLGERNQYDMDRLAIETVPSAQPVVISKSENTTECEDTVSKEAVSSWLKQYGQDVLHGKYKFSLMYIWKKLMDLPSVTPKQPGWIPVTERLPEDDRPVLVTLKWSEDDYEVTTGEYWRDSTVCHGWGNFGDVVIAWQPLPTPYREGGQDGKN